MRIFERGVEGWWDVIELVGVPDNLCLRDRVRTADGEIRQIRAIAKRTKPTLRGGICVLLENHEPAGSETS